MSRLGYCCCRCGCYRRADKENVLFVTGVSQVLVSPCADESKIHSSNWRPSEERASEGFLYIAKRNRTHSPCLQASEATRIEALASTAGSGVSVCVCVCVRARWIRVVFPIVARSAAQMNSFRLLAAAAGRAPAAPAAPSQTPPKAHTHTRTCSPSAERARRRKSYTHNTLLQNSLGACPSARPCLLANQQRASSVSVLAECLCTLALL